MITLIFVFFIQFIVTYYVIKFKDIFEINKYTGLQKSHEGFTPRLGGVIIVIFSYIYEIAFNQNSILFNLDILIGSLILLLIGLKEDLLGNVKPITRFIAIIIATFLFIYNLENFPTLNINLFNEFYEFKLFKIIFYVLAISTLTNGTNMIDGMNGLAGFTALSMFSSIILISFLYNEFELVRTCLVIIISIIGFMIFNFPKGLIFMGDTGAYWLGWITGILLIKLFALNDQINTWCLILVVSYPIIEVIFSSLRKIFSGYSPFQADHKHIHIKLFFALSKNKENANLINGLVSICLMPLWILPLGMVAWIDRLPILIFVAVFIQLMIYLLYYFILPTPNKKEYLQLFNKYKLK